jgi:hypothetical protein
MLPSFYALLSVGLPLAAKNLAIIAGLAAATNEAGIGWTLGGKLAILTPLAG